MITTNSCQSWTRWCRLCASTNAINNICLSYNNEHENIKDPLSEDSSADKVENNIFSNGSHISSVDIVKQLFCIDVVNQNENMPKNVCNTCNSLLISLISFSKRVLKVQAMYQQLLKMDQQSKPSDINLYEMRVKFGIFDQEDDNINVTNQELIDVLHEYSSNSSIWLQKQTTLKDNETLEELKNVTNGSSEDLTCYMKIIEGEIEEVVEDNKNNVQNTNYQYRSQISKTNEAISETYETFKCSQCSKLFKTINLLEKHTKIHKTENLPCLYCSKKFSSKRRVQQHIKMVHKNEKTYVCEECGITVRTNGALKGHMLTHTDFTPFVCEICKKGFKNQIRLKKHMETHDPNKHVCSKCGCQLNSRATLSRHLLVHSDEMTHKCDYCGRAFKRAKALKNHLILHTGLKPYSCDFCERTFANGSNCRSHKKKAHPKELAALEAAGGERTYTRNIPKLATLKAV